MEGELTVASKKRLVSGHRMLILPAMVLTQIAVISGARALIVIVVILVPLSPFALRPPAGPNQLNRSLEGFQCYLGTSASQYEVEALSLARAADGDWELGLELSIECRDRDIRTGPIGNCQEDV